jgi:pilus assembly protein Flp/PilA
MLAKFARGVITFLKRDDGPTAVEYAVMLAFIIVVCYVAVASVGSSASSTFSYDGLRNASQPLGS